MGVLHHVGITNCRVDSTHFVEFFLPIYLSRSLKIKDCKFSLCYYTVANCSPTNVTIIEKCWIFNCLHAMEHCHWCIANYTMNDYKRLQCTEILKFQFISWVAINSRIFLSKYNFSFYYFALEIFTMFILEEKKLFRYMSAYRTYVESIKA